MIAVTTKEVEVVKYCIWI